jgi:hypothetical protein
MGQFRQRSLVSCAVVSVLIGPLAGCHNPAENGDPRACQQSFEFGNTGCFEVSGQVVGLRGQALGGISVGPQPVPGPNASFNSAYQTTDSTGRFQIRLSRMAGGPPANGAPDTISVYVVAVDLRSTGPGVPATIVDSVLTSVTLAPVGTVPSAAEVRIILPVP